MKEKPSITWTVRSWSMERKYIQSTTIHRIFGAVNKAKETGGKIAVVRGEPVVIPKDKKVGYCNGVPTIIDKSRLDLVFDKIIDFFRRTR